MGLSFRRKKSSKQLSSRSQSSQALASTPTPNAYSVSNSINDNSTIATKQSVYSKSKLQQQYQQYPTYATEEEAPPQSLPPLGLSGAVVDPSDMAAGGSSHSNNVNARNINAWQEQAAAAAVGDDPSARRGSTGTDSVFDGLTLTSNRDSPMLYQQEQEVVMKQRPSRDATPTMNMRKQIMPPHHQESTTWQSNHSNTTTGRREPLQPQPKQFDPPPQSDPPAEQSKQMKARKLRVAMRREISRHRNGGSSSRQQQQQYKKTASAQQSPPIVASARNNLNMTTKIADIPSRPERSRDESLALTSAAYSRAESKTSRRSNNTTASRSTARTRTMKGAAAAGAVGATAVGAGMAASMARRNGKSYVDETTTLGDEDSAVPNNDYSEFPKVKEEDDEEDISVHASSFCSCGTTYDEDNETDNNTKDETMTYDEDGTYASGTYLDDDDATYETYESYEEDINHRRRHTTQSSSRRRLENNRSIDEESYLDDEASYMDGSIGTYLSEDDGEEDRSKRSVDPPAKDGTWASWFGFGGGGDANNEEEIAMMEDDTLMSPSDDGTREDDGTLDVDDGSTISHDQSTLGTKETVEDEETVDYEVRVPDGVNQQQQQQQQQQQDHLVASERTQVARNHNMSAAQSYDREGRPLLMEGATLPESKSMRRVSSFKKGWKMLKAPGSPGGSSIGKSTRSVGGGDKTVTTNDTPATVSTTYSKASSKDTSKVENTRNGSSSSATSADKAAEKDAKLWDTDERQRDLYCTKHGGVDMLTIRQYDAVPTPARPDHLLIKIEASTVSSKDCAIRLKGEPNTPPSPAVPGFHAVGTVAAIGTAVKSSSFKHGNRVAALLPNGGGNAKYISIPKTSAVLLPEDAHHEDIICLVANYMTAYQCLKLSKKDAMPLTNANVLITGGSGPVGQALVELALREGAKVYATAHKMHEEHLTKLGAKWFSVKPKKWLPHLEGKMDVVIDSLCIDGYESSYRALTPEGTLVCNTGNVSAQQLQDSSGSDSWIDTEGLNSWWNVQKAKYVWSRAIFYDLNESYAQNPKMFAHELHYLICKLQRGEIQPKVAGKVSLNQVPKAQKLIEKGLPNGTVVCLPWKKLDPKQKVKVEKKNVK